MSDLLHSPTSRRRWLGMAGVAALMVATAPRRVLAHPAHVTLAEAEFKRDRGVVQVSLRIHPEDLEAALRRAIDDDLRLEHRNIDDAIARYLRDRFVLRSAKGRAAPLNFVGSELDVHLGWVYFEFAVDRDLSGWTMSNQVFLELLADQVNTVVLRGRGPAKTYEFRRGKSSVPL